MRLFRTSIWYLDFPLIKVDRWRTARRAVDPNGHPLYVITTKYGRFQFHHLARPDSYQFDRCVELQSAQFKGER